MEANIEKKLCTYSGTSTVLYGGTVISLTANLVRGDASVNECTGILIKPKKLRVRIVWSTTNVYNVYRMIVFRWKDSSTPVGSGLLQTTGSGYAPISPINWVNHRKIKVLYDHMDVVYLHGVNTEPAKVHTITVAPGALPIQLPLNGAGAVPQMDGLYMLLISDDGIAPAPIADLYTELVYTDA